MKKPENYVGVDKDVKGGMTAIGKIVRDAWVFGLIPETETCEGWNYDRVNTLLQKVNNEWDKYGCLASHLPPELFQRYQDIQKVAIEKAREAGWSGEHETEDEK